MSQVGHCKSDKADGLARQGKSLRLRLMVDVPVVGVGVVSGGWTVRLWGHDQYSSVFSWSIYICCWPS